MKPYYEHGGIRIYHADCREWFDSVPACFSVDAVVTDPPYGINFRGYASHVDDEQDYANLLLPVVGYVNSHLKDGGMAFFWQSMNHLSRFHQWFPPEYRLFAAAKNFTQSRPVKVQFSWDPVVFWSKGKSEGRAPCGMRDYHIGNAAKYVAEPSWGHPCPRPIDTVKYIVGLASDAGEIILDCFAGSGTTLVAAKDLGRRAIGIEIEEKYCEIAAKRLSQEVLNFGA